jgi:hypothetical protein
MLFGLDWRLEVRFIRGVGRKKATQEKGWLKVTVVVDELNDLDQAPRSTCLR